MKVYVITKGEYSDYHICAVSVDKEKAKMLQKVYSTSYEEADIEEFDTDEEEERLKYNNVYSCWYHKSDYSVNVSESCGDYFRPDDLKVEKTRYGLYTNVLADTEEEALKIASDKFAKYRAEQLGL